MLLRRRWARIGQYYLALAGALCIPPTLAQPAAAPPQLNQLVRLPAGWTTLAQVLAEASRQSKVPISYSSTRLATSRRVYVPAGPPRPLRTVLCEVLGAQHVTYGLLSGQVVLWPARQNPPPGITNVNGRDAATDLAVGDSRHEPALAGRRVGETLEAHQAASASAIVRKPASGQAANAAPPGALPLAGSVAKSRDSSRPAYRKALSPLAADDAKRITAEAPVAPVADASELRAASRHAAHALRKANKLARISRKQQVKTSSILAANATRKRIGDELATSIHTKKKAPPSATADVTATPGSRANPGQAIPALPVRLIRADVQPSRLPETAALAPLPVPAAPRKPLAQRLAQLSLVYPLSTNGVANSRTTNLLSVNLLAGYSAGVNLLEIGGLMNVVRDSVRGLQGAGLVNVVGTTVRGVQLAGMVNVTGGSVSGIQGAGLVNVGRDDVRGIQIAGLVNVVGGAGSASSQPDQPTRVRRWLGLPRLLATDALAQLPIAPSTSAPGPLLQAAGIANLTGTDVRGLQTSALLNLARRVKGAQCGIVNIARHVQGVQIGLINIADSVDGVPIGLINIVRHGYLRGEVWASEALPLNAAIKLGVRRYYTIIGASAEPFGSHLQWATGLGIGTAGLPHGRFTFSLDALHWTLAGSSDNADEKTDLRTLTQLRPAVAWQIERNGHLQLVVAPTLNLAIAWSNDHQPTWDFGANQLLLIDTAGAQSRTRLWLGLQVGLRF